MARDTSSPRGGVSNLSVGRYQIMSHIASGGMGAVYLAFDPTLNRTVALKVLSPEMASKPTMVQRFQREAKAAAKLKHENIVQIFDFGEANGTLFLALEFVDGTDLQNHIDQRPGGRLDVEETIGIAIQAAKALDHAYAQGIVHRDIKPSNFLVTTKGGALFVKLTDMGLAREADDARITRDNTTLGTVDYISPEQARDAGSADTRSDLYSLGCSIFHMLVGHGPFPRGTLIEKVQHHLSTPAPDVRAHRSDVSDHLANVLFKLLEKEPTNRYETPLHLLHDLMSTEEFAEYLKLTQELARPVFRPPVHRPRTISATVLLSADELMPPPDPLFPSDFQIAKEEPEATVALPTPPPPVEVPVAEVPPPRVEPEPLPAPVKPEVAIEPRPPRPEKPAQAPRIVPRDKPQRAVEIEQSIKTKGEPRKPKPKPHTRPIAPAAKERLRRLEKRRLLRNPLWVGGIVGGLLFAAFGVWAMMALFRPRPHIEPIDPNLLVADDKEPVPPPTKVIDEPPPKPAVLVKLPPFELIQVNPMLVEPSPIATGKIGPELPEIRPLTKLIDKIDVAAVERTTVGPHGEFPKPADGATVLRVTRGAAPRADSFASFADAWREAGKRPAAIIEIHDHGPLAIPSLPSLPATNLTIRAAPGVRPLLVWDKKPGDTATTWMPLERGSLILDDLDLLVRDDSASAEPSFCVAVSAGDVAARNVTLTQSGDSKGGVAFFRIAGRGGLPLRPKPAANDVAFVNADEPQLARLENCFLRGPSIIAAYIAAINADLFIDRSLVVGHRQPSVLIIGGGSDIANVRSLRSTLASAKAIVHFQPTPGQAIAPRLGVFGLDSLLVHPEPHDGNGVLLSLDESVGTSGLSAKIANTAFAGWPTLLRARQTKIATLAEWRTQWGHRDGDVAVPDCWPPLAAVNIHGVAPLNLSPLGSAVAFATLKNDALVGCPVGHLPSEPHSWRLRAPSALPLAAIGLPDFITPVIRPPGDGLYHGEIIDLSKVNDLGEYLLTQNLAPHVVLHLTGKGTFRTSPLRLRGTHLVLYAPPVDGPTLEFQTAQGVSAAALIDVDQGELDLINVRVRLDWKKLADMPTSLIRVRDGSLSMARCVLQTPLTKVPLGFNSLIAVETTQASAPSRFTCRDCVLLAGSAFVALEGPAVLMRCHRSLILAMDDAVLLKPGPLDQPPNIVGRFEYNTFVLDKAFLRVQSPARLPNCSPPIPIHAVSNYFSSPTPGGNALLLRSEGEALARGLLAWRGQANAFDLGAFSRALAWGREFGPTPFPQAWTDHWGHAAEADPLHVPAKQPAAKVLNLEQPNFDRFILPTTLRLDLPGANMQQLIALLAAPKKK